MINKKKVVAIVQARMGSSRFPGKVLSPILTESGYDDFDPEMESSVSVLELLCLRLAASEHIDQIVVATPDTPLDQMIWAHVASTKENPTSIHVFQGSEDNVLDRVVQAARANEAEIIVDVTADCPFVDPEMIDEMLSELAKDGLDYCSNVMTRTWPDGFDAQVYTMSALENLIAYFPVRAEHTGWNFIQNKEGFNCRNFPAPHDLEHPEWELTVDHRADLQLLRVLLMMVLFMERGGLGNTMDALLFPAETIILLLERFPELLKINQGLHRKEESNPAAVIERIEFHHAEGHGAGADMVFEAGVEDLTGLRLGDHLAESQLPVQPVHALWLGKEELNSHRLLVELHLLEDRQISVQRGHFTDVLRHRSP